MSLADEAYYRDSLVGLICATRDTDAISAIEHILQEYYGGSCPIAIDAFAKTNHSTNDIHVFPNPNNGVFFILCNPYVRYNIHVTDNLGTVVYEERNAMLNSKSVQLDERLPSGTYTLQITSSGGTYVQKLLIMR
ncbi:MAG: T9SS type A sorting domain-containing protein [Bacteroidetes bacterium]|nr:T9SS type A sorting domain-containing protein [Bacteroidota bacterium]